MSAAYFANVNNNGNANYNNASNSNGVRPDSVRLSNLMSQIRKEKISLGNLNDSGIKPGPEAEACPMCQVTTRQYPGLNSR